MKDGAPWLAEDKDGFEDADGVPDLDNDGDGILDLDDAKPNDAETRNRWHDADGAPDSFPQLESIHYAIGSAAVTSETKGYLRGISELLKEWPEVKLHLRGHTDDSDTERLNQDLSQRRTEIIRRYLIEVGTPPNQIVVSFYGETLPANVNQSARDKAENRRVELILE
jgi:outer membrane protein OmpA-like peptidoglycan-associated protein